MLIRGTRLIEGVLIQFFPNRDEIGSGFSVIYGVSVPQKDPVS